MKYATILADPPWYYEKSLSGVRATYGEPGSGRARGGRMGKIENGPFPYPTMTVERIAAMPVASLAAGDAHLWLWTTNRYLRDAYSVVDAWGFDPDRVTPLVWCKNGKGWRPGGTFASTVEFLLFARRGNLPAKDRVRYQWFQWPVSTTHSRKPDPSYGLVQRVSPGPYLELFGRRHMSGWETWGNQVNCLDEEVVAALGDPAPPVAPRSRC